MRAGERAVDVPLQFRERIRWQYVLQRVTEDIVGRPLTELFMRPPHSSAEALLDATKHSRAYGIQPITIDAL